MSSDEVGTCFESKSRKTKENEDFYKDFCLQDYIRCKMVKKVKTLLHKGLFDVNSKNSDESMAALHVAADMGHTVFLKMLIDAGADVNVRDYHFNQTPLHLAKNIDTVKILIQARADVNALSSYGSNVLHEAVKYDKLSIIEFLVASCNADVHAKTASGYTPLHAACCSSLCENGFNLKIVKFFLKNNANLNTLMVDGKTPLISFLSINKPVNNEIKKFLRFLIKYSNINLGRYSDLTYVNNKNMMEIFLQHLALLESLNMSYNSCQEIINKKSGYDNYFKKCIAELALAKDIKIRDSWVTFFNLLTDNKTKLKNYAGNKNLIKNFKNFDKFSNKFPLYGRQIQEKVKKGIRRRELFDESCVLLSNCLLMVNPTHLIIIDILNNMSTKDLSKFCTTNVGASVCA